MEVSKPDYDACSASSPIASFQTGNDIVPLRDGASRGLVGAMATPMQIFLLNTPLYYVNLTANFDKL